MFEGVENGLTGTVLDCDPLCTHVVDYRDLSTYPSNFLFPPGPTEAPRR